MNRFSTRALVVLMAIGTLTTGCANSEASSAPTSQGEPSPSTRPASNAAVDTSVVTDDAGTTDSTTTSVTATTTASVPRPEPLVADIALVELIAPDPVVTDVAPEFAWAPVAGAVNYRLVVLGTAEPVWAWEGGATSIRLGGLTADAGPAFPVPELVTGSTWSVAALDGDGNVIAVSDRRAVSRP
jgi:hypothetical protein